MPFSASSALALSFLASANPIPRRICGALVNWIFEYSMTSMRLPHGSRKSRNGPSTILAPAASARTFTEERSSTTKPICRRSTPLAAWSGTCVKLMNWSPMSMKALRSPRPRNVKSKILPYQSSASPMSATSIATWLMPTSRGFLPSTIVPSSREQITSGHMGRPTRRVQAQRRLASIAGDALMFGRSREHGHMTDWIITTAIGTGEKGFAGDGGPATAALLNGPFDIAFDVGGDLFFSDTFNQRVRRVDAATGIITTVGGNGEHGYRGDRGPATAGSPHEPARI